MTPTFYMAFIPAIIASLLALSIRDCDNSGMAYIKKYDPGAITAFDDIISRTFACPY